MFLKVCFQELGFGGGLGRVCLVGFCLVLTDVITSRGSHYFTISSSCFSTCKEVYF